VGAPARDVFFFVPHTHWEGAVFQTREAYLDMGLPNILRALRLLQEYPGYRFTLDQVCYVRPFLERYPEQEAALRRFIQEGRLAIVGGTDVMPDVNMPCGESFVRQVLYGKRYFRERLGVDVTVGWQLDTFGHHAQLPQLLRLAGYRSFWFFRGVGDWDVPAEFLWEGLDGSRLQAFWLPHGYALTYESPKTLPEFTRFFQERFDSLAPFARGRRGRVGLAGADVCAPEPHVPALVEAFNRQADAPFELRLAVPADYEAFVAQRACGTGGEAAGGAPEPETVVSGELNPIFQGTYSSRIELKQRLRELEGLLLTLEKLGALLQVLGLPTDPGIVWRAWEPVLFNQTHDLMSGVMTDAVYQDTLRGFDFSKRLAMEELGTRLRAYASRIDTRGAGIPLVVFNPLGWSRTDVAFADVGLAEPGIAGLELRDVHGRPVPVQLVHAERDGAGALLCARIAFVAADVPALGHCVYRLLPAAAAPPAEPTQHDLAVLENEHHRVEVDSTGAITGLRLRADGWEALAGPGNVVALEEDRGDLWELYRPLDGGSRIAMRDVHGVPARGAAVFSDEQRDGPCRVTAGPVFSEACAAHPLGTGGTFRTRVRVYAGLRRIEVRTQLLNTAEFVRYRVLFPTSIEGGYSVHEIPFGALQRPAGVESAAQNWVDHGDGRRGVALLNRGLPGNNVADGTLLLSLCRSSRIVAYGFGGGYGPGMSSDSGLELGQELSFDYAVLPHRGDWREAGVYRDGMEFNHPLLAVPSAAHAGVLPARWGFLQVSSPQVVVSALKPGEDGDLVLRCYDAGGRGAAGLELRFAAEVVAAEEVNLVEDAAGPLPISDRVLRLDLTPFAIRTVRVRCAAGGAAAPQPPSPA